MARDGYNCCFSFWAIEQARRAGTLLKTKADLPQLVYEEICSKFYFKTQFIFG